MAKFRSIPHEVTAVQWKGEVTLELQALLGTNEVTVTNGSQLVVRKGDSPLSAEIGDWVVRMDYELTKAVEHGDPGSGRDARCQTMFDLDVMEPDDFIDGYAPS